MEIHAVDAGDEGRRQQGHRCHGEYLDDLVLVDVDEADRGIHQEVDLVEQEGGMAIQRLDVAQDLAGIIELVTVQEFSSAHQE